MANIKVGIVENVAIESVSVDEQFGALNINFVEKSDVEVDLFEAMSSGQSLDSENKSTVKKFPQGHKRFGKEATAEELVRFTIEEEKALLNHLLENYNPGAKIDFSTMWDNTGIESSADIQARLADEDTMKKVCTNMYKAFVRAMADADKSIKNRVKFYRQSEAKNFIALPSAIAFKKNSTESFKTPFIESMIIPVEQSKLKYTDYEKGIRASGANTWDKSNPDAVVADTTPSGDEQLPF